MDNRHGHNLRATHSRTLLFCNALGNSNFSRELETELLGLLLSGKFDCSRAGKFQQTTETFFNILRPPPTKNFQHFAIWARRTKQQTEFNILRTALVQLLPNSSTDPTPRSKDINILITVVSRQPGCYEKFQRLPTTR